MSVGQISVGQMSVGQMSVGLMSLGQMSLGQVYKCQSPEKKFLAGTQTGVTSK
jgi:hypothetical protein